MQEVLTSYTGSFQADAFPDHDKLFKETGPFEAGCWTHVPRGFFDARESDPVRTGAAMTIISVL